MKGKTIAAAVFVLAAGASTLVALRSNSRAEAATNGCFAAEQGPSKPTICE